MGNSSSKDERKASRPSSLPHGTASQQVPPGQASPQHPPSSTDRLAGRLDARSNGSGSARGSTTNLAFFLGRDRDRDVEANQSDRPRETKQEREARKAEKDRQARLKERERSIREEHVDGGFLVTLGTYTGVEDFSKQIVRQLQIERKLAPFWKGLNDHSDSWTEWQLVAAARGLPIPAADEVPPEMARTASHASNEPRSSDSNVHSLTVPIGGRSQSYQSDRSAQLSSSQPTFSNSGPSSPINASSASSQLFRGRAKTLASLATGNKSQSPDLTPQEVRLPNDPNVHGQPLEAYLYKDASECPICFLYYPPYLNRTRCCDQPICSECFVQIKRPDPHPPEHEQPGQPRPPEEEAEQLVSEVAACPFCVTPEFGVTYDPPPFRRGLAYAHQQNPLRNPTSAMSSSSSLQSPAGRRRATSLSANEPRVVTTDKVRPDWAKKLADARAHALRRSAAATALHNAAYVLGNQGEGRSGGFALGRRRRTLFGDSPQASGSGTPQEGEFQAAVQDILRRRADARGAGDGSGDIAGGRTSSRRNRVEDLEDLMMMEAIRLSLAAEEERKRKEEKEAQKDAKKRAKADRKEEKKAEKAAKKNGSGSLYRAGTNESTSSWAGTSGMARSTSNLGAQPVIPEEANFGKGKQPIQDFAGFNPLSEPSSTLNRPASPSHAASSPSVGNAQRHLEVSRATLESSPVGTPGRPSHMREISNVSSAASSFVESSPGSNLASNNASGVDLSNGGVQADSGSRSGSNDPTPGTNTAGESMFNFGSLAAMIDSEEKPSDSSQHLEHAPSQAQDHLKEPSPTGSPRIPPARLTTDGNRSRGDSGESSSTAPPPVYVEAASPTDRQHHDKDNEITSAPPTVEVQSHSDRKEFETINVLDHGHTHETR